MMRSKLFVPGSRPEFYEKAMTGEADALSFDLEDAVVAERKDEARRRVSDFLGELGPGQNKLMIARVNPVTSSLFDEDVDALVGPALEMINLPKPESAEDVERAAISIERSERRKGLPAGHTKLLVNIESPRGLRLAHEIAVASKRIAGLQIGFGDLFAPLRIRRDPIALGHVWMTVRLAAAEAGVAAYDGAYTHIKDIEGLEAEARAVQRLGYLGKSCLHPTQVALVNRVFTPTEAEVGHALAVEAALADPANAGKGAFMVDGRMIDEPFVREAQQTLALARRLGLVS